MSRSSETTSDRMAKEGGETMTKYIYTVYDRRNAQEVGRYLLPDISARSENLAIRWSGLEPRFAAVETREVSEEAARPWVGR